MKKIGRNKLKKIVFLALLVVTVIYSVKLKEGMDAYKAWLIEYELQHPGALMPNFWRTPFADHFALIGLLLSISVLTTSYLSFRKTKFLTKLLAATAIFLSCSIIIFPALAVDTITYDVWVVKDEETGHLDGILNDLWRVEQYYRITFNIEIRWHYWENWDSPDDESRIDKLLEEAVEKTGWYWQKEVDGEPMELMLVFTGQDTNIPGYSPPWLRACIVQKVWLWDVEFEILHEFGHQFGLGHCPLSDCAMRSTQPVLIDPYKYCSSCEEKLYANRECLNHPPPPPPPPPSPPPSPRRGGGGSGCYYK